MHRGVGLLVAVLLVASMTCVPAPAGAETRVDHGDDGFTIHDNATFVAPAGEHVNADARLGVPVAGVEANTGNYKAYDFIVDPPADKDARYDITVDYDRQVSQFIPILGETVCGAELHMQLIDENGSVVDEETRACIDDLDVDGLGLNPGAYEVDVWMTDTSMALTEFSVEIDVEYF